MLNQTQFSPPRLFRVQNYVFYWKFVCRDLVTETSVLSLQLKGLKTKRLESVKAVTKSLRSNLLSLLLLIILSLLLVCSIIVHITNLILKQISLMSCIKSYKWSSRLLTFSPFMYKIHLPSWMSFRRSFNFLTT